MLLLPLDNCLLGLHCGTSCAYGRHEEQETRHLRSVLTYLVGRCFPTVDVDPDGMGVGRAILDHDYSKFTFEPIQSETHRPTVAVETYVMKLKLNVTLKELLKKYEL